MIKDKVLNVAIQDGKASQAQMNAMNSAIDYGNHLGIKVIFTKIK